LPLESIFAWHIRQSNSKCNCFDIPLQI